MTSLPTLAVFGSTGECINATLKLALKSSHRVSALVRTPSKLADISSAHPKTLQVIPGDIRDLAAVKSTLLLNDRIVDIIISGVGMLPVRKGFRIDFTDHTICEDGTKSILAALSALRADGYSGNPRIIALSTTGLSDLAWDVPFLFTPIYRYMLGIPHADKKKMEQLLIKSGEKWTVVRASLLWGSGSRGMGAVRVGCEIPGVSYETKKGYTISKEDVGTWVFEECVKVDGDKWLRSIPSITY